MSNDSLAVETDPIELSVILPVRDDAPSVNVMVRILTVMIDVPCELLVVYDDPDDPAVPVIARMQAQYPRVRGVLNGRPGVLNAVRRGVEDARGRFVLIYAVDEIVPVLAIGRMLALMESGCDFVSGTRYRDGGRRYGGSLLGHVLSRMANALFRMMSATAFSDCTTGFKMFRRELFRDFEFSNVDRGWSFAFELAILAQLAPLRLAEVPIVSIDRLFGGRSSFKPIPWIISYLRCFVWGVGMLPPWHRPRPQLVTRLEGRAS